MSEVLREPINEGYLNRFSIQDVHDKLFSIPPLAIKCKMARIRHYNSLSYWEMYDFTMNIIKKNCFAFNGAYTKLIDS